jgi:WD40 repeat protein
VVLPLSEHKGAIRSLAWRGDGQVLASTGEDGLIVWWDVARGWPSITKPDAHPPERPAGVHGKIASGVLDAAFGPTGELVTAGRDRKVRLWAEDGRELKTFAIDGASSPGIRVLPTRVALTFDGSTVVAGDSAGRIHSWATGKSAPASR